ncbi:MAG: tyrosine-type recombinase/integrase [Actinomycetota bacterium]|nr:tyrosine-type recombinase/integrase [Actinomycetota bacterium]
MPLSKVAVPAEAAHLYEAYLAWSSSRGVGNKTFDSASRTFLVRFPDPEKWASQPLEVRLRANGALRPFLNFCMFFGHLHPGYDWLLERRLHAVLRDAALSPLGDDLVRFRSGAEALGYSESARRSMTSQVAARLLIQSGRHLADLHDEDYAQFEDAISEREVREGHRLAHYRGALYASRAVIYHLGAPAEPAPKRSTLGRWSWERHLEGVGPQIRRPMVAYLERLEGTHARSSIQGIASELAHFGRFLARRDPGLASLSLLDRRRHIEPYLSEVAHALNQRSGQPIAASTAKSRILALGSFFDAMAEWGWDEAPSRRLVFSRDVPKLPHPLPRYLAPDDDRALVSALEASPNRLLADALLLLRETGLRIGELCDLELDCVHEVAGQGAWLKVPLGKLMTERMVPLDDDTVGIVDRIVANRSQGRPLRHPRTGALVEFLLTHQGRRISACTLRAELHRAAAEAGLDDAVPHQLRHTYATALVNAGCSLQALMALLGHVSAEMSLRYGRLFDQTVRENYERALAQAKTTLGPVLPEATPIHLETDWRKAPLIKARLAGGYCLRTAAQGPCAYANICEHCPNFRSEKTLLPVLQLQRVDAEALVADAEERGWGPEAARHRRLIERIDALIAKANAG